MCIGTIFPSSSGNLKLLSDLPIEGCHTLQGSLVMHKLQLEPLTWRIRYTIALCHDWPKTEVH